MFNKERALKHFLVIFLFLCNLSGFAQTSISGIVNSYFSVTSINQPLCDPCVASCIHTITVSGSSGLAVGDKALIIQMKGATIDTRNIATAGNVTAINNTGNYEFFEIKSIAGNVVTPMYPLLKSYDTANGMVQVVRVPRYNGDVNIAGKLTAKEWTTAQKNGGVLAIETSGRLIFNADIDVAGQGYEGIRMDQNGPDNNCGPDPTALYVLNSTATASYTKGDGIVLDNANFNRGRAPRANGGGSGIAGDSGGGGGSNYGAGGEGGKRWCDANGASAGGLGGKSLSAFFADDRVFLGGAGGSGYVTTNNPSSAADGGGIVIIFAKEIVGNGHSIIADGFSPQPVNVSGDPDGGGGGGAGGTVVLKTPLFTGNLTVSAKGGDGQDLNTTTLHGPGGGGGGGALLYSLAALPANVTMNSSGGIGGQHTGGARNGSQDGYAGGSVSLYVPVENPNYVGIDDEDGLSIECDLDDDNDGILDTVELHGLPDPFEYQSGSKKPNFLNPSAPGFVDTNKDTVDDRYDNDLDGMIDQLDLDSDNDGCPDSVEAYGNTNVDPDNNGFYGTGLPPATNANGTVVAASYTTPVNTTGTSKPNYLVSNIVAITTSPSNRNANVGGNATFSTVVSGTHLVYTWKQSTNGGTTWTTVTNGGTNPVFSNATTNSLTLTNIPRSFHGYMYRLDVTSTSNVCAQPNSDTAILSIVNRAPVALNNSYSVDEGATLTTTAATGVLTNDSDADGDALTAVLVTNPSHGSLTLNANGSFTYVHDGSETTSDSFTYKANDGYDDSDTVTVNITVNPVNDAPVADNDSYTVAEGGTLTVTAAKSILLNDTDAENNTLTAVLVTNPSHGTLTLNPDGTFTYIHDGSETLTDSFTYRANDGLLNSNTATVNITITPVNDAPVANDDPYTVAEDNTVTLTPLSNDTDVEGDALSIVSINGTALTGNAQTIAVSNGTVDISALGVITFTPTADFNSTTPISIPYIITDGNLTATANIKITVTAVNDAPVANDDPYTVAEDNTVTLTPLSNDTDVEGDALSIVSINGTALTGNAQTIAVSNGTVDISASGTITFTPSADFNSTTPISIPYIITDGNLTATANIKITVTAVNDAPVANDDPYTVAEDNTVTLTPLSNDTDVEGDALSIVSINGTALTGNAQTIAVSNGTVDISALGVITFTPSANFNSTTPISIPYVISDGHVGSTATANIKITVTAVNDAPVAEKDGYSVNEGETLTVITLDGVLSNDSDIDGDSLTSIVVTGPSHGTLTLNLDGSFTYIHDGSETTKDSFTYKANDGNLDSNIATVTITINPVNDLPVANDDPYTVAEDNSVTLTPLSNDTDAEGDTLSIVSINGTTLTGNAQTITVSNGTVDISASGVITFTPSANFNSTTPISIPYVISDGHVGSTATANIKITVTAVNDAPVANDDPYTVAEDNTVTLTPLSNDTDVEGDALSIVSINGTALTGGVQTITVSNGTVDISASGTITFTPSADFNSTTPISIPYIITDGNLTATANIKITVTAVNDAPVGNDDPYTVAEDNTVTLTPLSNDTDVEGDALSIVSINGTALTGNAQTIAVSNGTVDISALGVITFTPSADFNSTTPISIPYIITDGNLTATANIKITVTAVNDAPVANDDPYTVAEDNTVTLTPLSNDTDVEGDALSIVSINGTALTGNAQTIAVSNGTVDISASGTITFTPSANFNSTTPISIPYIISDGNLTATANIKITVTAVNDAPVANDDPYTVAEDSTVTLTPLSNDTDVEGDALSIVSINGTALTGNAQTIAVSNGTVDISALGVITFTPSADFNSTTPISIPYIITDGNLTATANIKITVTAVNDAPVGNDDPYTVAEDNTVTLTPLSNDTDVEGDALSIVSINGTALTGNAQTIAVSNGTVDISASGTITFTPSADFNSTTPISIPYIITDGNLTATANIKITVTAVNDAPVANDDPYTVAEDNTVTLTPLSNDTDVEGDALSIVSINGTALTGNAQTIAVSNGTVDISALGVITFTPSADFNSTTPISIPYIITDGNLTATANIKITVTAVNDAPVANDDTNGSIPSTANATLINALTATDIDGTIANYTVVTLPGHGTLALSGTAVTVNQILTPSEVAMLTYDPSGSFTGNDTFTFIATDDLGADSAPATITIIVGNNAPTAIDDVNNGIPSNAGATAINTLTATDTDGTIVNYIVETLPSYGVLALSGIPVTANQILTPAEAAMLTYDPSGAFSGNDSFTFTATDNNGAVDATPATITIPVIKRDLVAIKDEIGSVVGINEVVKVINVLDNDTLDHNPLIISDINLNVLTPDPNNVLTLKPDGTIELIPNAPAGTYTLTYEICEKANSRNCTSATVSVTVVAPTMTIKAESYCSNNAAYVSYSVTPDNFTPTGSLTINWIDSANNVVATQTNMSLSGNVLWPGTVVDGNNRPTDWPGWVLVNGQWMEGADGFELTRPAVTMQFTLNPTQSVIVNYPAATTGCNAKPQFGIEAGNDNDIARADGINGSLELINVLDNDKLNGLPVNPEDVILTGNNFPAGITLNADGTIDVAPGTQGGNHTLTYQICEKANSNNCSTATIQIFVEVPSIALIMKVSSDDNNGNGAIEAGETLTYTFTVTNNGNVPLENISISDLLPGVILKGGPINLAVGTSDGTTFTATYTLTQADINSGMVSNQSTVSAITQSGIAVTDKSDAENTGGDKPTVIEFNGCDIKIFNAVSLNGDNMNERFYIRGIECYPNNTVQIFNRWGVLVFERDHYNNNDVVFKGYSEGRTTVKESNGLPEGTYYYILRYKDNQSKPRQEAGYLYLTK